MNSSRIVNPKDIKTLIKRERVLQLYMNNTALLPTVSWTGFYFFIKDHPGTTGKPGSANAHFQKLNAYLEVFSTGKYSGKPTDEEMRRTLDQLSRKQSISGPVCCHYWRSYRSCPIAYTSRNRRSGAGWSVLKASVIGLLIFTCWCSVAWYSFPIEILPWSPLKNWEHCKPWWNTEYGTMETVSVRSLLILWHHYLKTQQACWLLE